MPAWLSRTPAAVSSGLAHCPNLCDRRGTSDRRRGWSEACEAGLRPSRRRRSKWSEYLSNCAPLPLVTAGNGVIDSLAVALMIKWQQGYDGVPVLAHRTRPIRSAASCCSSGATWL